MSSDRMLVKTSPKALETLESGNKELGEDDLPAPRDLSSCQPCASTPALVNPRESHTS